MSSSVTKAGPYFSSGSISFSSLRNAFKETTSGSIKASELRRNTDTENRNPIVPDATENSPISTGSNLKVSQFRNSIKYYYITQSGTDENLIINDLSIITGPSPRAMGKPSSPPKSLGALNI